MLAIGFVRHEGYRSWKYYFSPIIDSHSSAYPTVYYGKEKQFCWSARSGYFCLLEKLSNGVERWQIRWTGLLKFLRMEKSWV